MSLGMRERRARPEALPSDTAFATIRYNGGSIFAEHPATPARDARIIWHADFDPGALRVVASPADPGDPDAVDPRLLVPWLTVAMGHDAREHAVLSDGWHHIRLDVERGTLATAIPTILHYRLQGIDTAQRALLPLRGMIYLCRYRRFPVALFPPEPTTVRAQLLLKVHDALAEGASQKEIARALVGPARADGEWNGRSDALRSRVRRLVKDVRRMAQGEYRNLLRRR